MKEQEQFIVVSRPRVGTHMLRGGLNSHTGIHCADELLNIWMLLPQLQACLTLTEFRKRIKENNPHKFTGWVLHDDQYHYPIRRCIRVKQGEWGEIPSKTKIIRLNRRNELARLTSQYRAYLSNTWMRTQRRIYADDDLPFHMDFNKLMHWYDFQQESYLTQEEYLKRFPNIHRVWYEDLVDDWNNQMKQVFDFLGVDNTKVAPRTMKMGQPLRYMVSNYDELQKKCRDTELGQYFD